MDEILLVRYEEFDNNKRNKLFFFNKFDSKGKNVIS